MSWLGFGAPLWLAGLAALALPLAIHLLSRGRQRRLPIGSVRWLAAAQTLRARRLRPSRWWLLLLRCLLLAAVVLALAEPRFGVAADPAPRPWLLIAPEVMSERGRLEAENREAFATVERAVAEGAEIRWLAPGLPRGELAAPPAAAGEPLWSLLVEADLAAPVRASWIVVTTGRADALAGARPALDRTIEWIPVLSAAPNRWLARIVTGPGDQGMLTVGTSDAAATRFERRAFDRGTPSEDGVAGDAAEEGATDDFVLRATAKGREIALLDGGVLTADDTMVLEDSALEASPGTLAVTLFSSPEREQDLRYVRAGLAAAARVAGRELAVRELPIDARGWEADRDLLVFWLSGTPVAPWLLDGVGRGLTLVSDALDRFEGCGSAFRPDGAARPLRVDRCGPVDDPVQPAEAGILWAGEFGRPLLSGDRLASGTWLRFASRFNPDWTDLVLAPEFPRWLLELIEGSAPRALSATGPRSDRRAAGDQARPRRATAPAADAAIRRVSWSAGLWLQVLLLAAAERWWAWRGAP